MTSMGITGTMMPMGQMDKNRQMMTATPFTSQSRPTMNRPLSTISSAAAAAHTRRPYGSSALASDATLVDPVDLMTPKKHTPLDDVPPLFQPEVLEELSKEKPYLQDIQTIVTTLQQLTQESAIDANEQNGLPTQPTIADPASLLAVVNPLTNPVHIPNVALGWTGHRKQMVGEMMLQLNQAIDKLLIDRHYNPHLKAIGIPTKGPGIHPPNPLANLRSEFLSSREILALIHSHASNLSNLAPSLLALSKVYQNRLLEFQGMNELSLEYEPIDKFKEKYEEQKKKDELKKKLASEAAAAPKLWDRLRQKSRLAVGGSVRHSRTATRGSISLSKAVQAAIAAPAPVQPVPPSPPPMDPKWRRLENQGSLDMYLPWNLIRREMHLFNPQIVELTKIYWRACFMDEYGKVHLGIQPPQSKLSKLLSRSDQLDDDSDSPDPVNYADGGLLIGLPKKSYMHLYCLVHYILKPSYLPSYAQQVVAQDWLTDTHMSDQPSQANRVLMTLPQFHLGLFSLVDTWTEGVTLEEYVTFLKNLFEFVTEPVKPSTNEQTTKPTLKSFFESDSDSDEDEDSKPSHQRQPQQSPSIDPSTFSSVYSRRLKPLTIVNINNLRKLGLRAESVNGGSFKDLTRAMLEEIEMKANIASAVAAGEIDTRLTRNNRLSHSSSLTALATDTGYELEKDYHPTTSFNKSLTSSDMRPPSPNAELERVQSGHRRNLANNVAFTNSTQSSQPIPPWTPVTQKTIPKRPWTSATPTTETSIDQSATQPMESLSERKPHRRQLSSAPIIAPPLSGLIRPSSNSQSAAGPSSSVQQQPTGQLKPSRTQVEIEARPERIDESFTELDFDEPLEPLDPASITTPSTPSTPTSPISPTSPSGKAVGQLSWRRPSVLSSDESYRLISGEMAAMEAEHKQWKAKSAEEREQERRAHQDAIKQGLQDLAEEDEAAGARRRRKLKRRPASLRTRSNDRGSEGEKQRRYNAMIRNPPLSTSTPVSLLAAKSNPQEKQPIRSPFLLYNGQPVRDFEAERQQFAAETAAYLEKLKWLKMDADNQARAINQQHDEEQKQQDQTGAYTLYAASVTGGIIPEYLRTMTVQSPMNGSEAKSLHAHSLTSPRSSKLLQSSPRAFTSGVPRVNYAHRQPTPFQDDFRNRPFHLTGSVQSTTIRTNSSASSASSSPPPPRVTTELSGTNLAGSVTTPLTTPRPPSAFTPSSPPPVDKSPRRPSTASASTRRPHPASFTSTRYCDCFECTELFVRSGHDETRGGSFGRIHANQVHALLHRETQPSATIHRLQRMIDQ